MLIPRANVMNLMATVLPKGCNNTPFTLEAGIRFRGA
jgi:hypothetical protein